MNSDVAVYWETFRPLPFVSACHRFVPILSQSQGVALLNFKIKSSLAHTYFTDNKTNMLKIGGILIFLPN